MKSTLSFKICGQSGQGIDTIGKILCNVFISCGLYSIGYREYPSLIKGGNASFQIEVSDRDINSTQKKVDFVIILNEQQTLWYEKEIRSNGFIFHNIRSPRFSPKEVKEINNKNLQFGFINSEKILHEAAGSPKMKNIAVVAKVCQMLGIPLGLLQHSIKSEFKDEIIAKKNCTVASVAYKYNTLDFNSFNFKLHPLSSAINMEPMTEESFQSIIQSFTNNLAEAQTNTNPDLIMISGNEAITYGALLSKVRSFYAYPMTPSSSILSTFGKIGEEYGVLVKQVDDEITAAGMTLGSMMVGERSLTATSGGGFDLMSEHISYALIAEIPYVIVLAQRPGPATGLPTWTSQSDALLSIFSGHGEAPRIVIALSDAKSCFEEIQTAFNLAEYYQSVVIVLTDKLLAETYFTLDISKVKKYGIINASNTQKGENYSRYSISENGVSPYWKIGEKEKYYTINSDEHDENGDASEDSENAAFMVEKRNLKNETILSQMPSPILKIIGKNNSIAKYSFKLISWGSTYGVIKDILEEFNEDEVYIEWLHVNYLYPIKENIFNDFVDKYTIIVEGNYTSQLSKIIRMETGVDIPFKITKYDGRPFFRDELYTAIINILENEFDQ